MRRYGRMRGRLRQLSIRISQRLAGVAPAASARGVRCRCSQQQIGRRERGARRTTQSETHAGFAIPHHAFQQLHAARGARQRACSALNSLCTCAAKPQQRGCQLGLQRKHLREAMIVAACVMRCTPTWRQLASRCAYRARIAHRGRTTAACRCWRGAGGTMREKPVHVLACAAHIQSRYAPARAPRGRRALMRAPRRAMRPPALLLRAGRQHAFVRRGRRCASAAAAARAARISVHAPAAYGEQHRRWQQRRTNGK